MTEIRMNKKINEILRVWVCTQGGAEFVCRRRADSVCVPVAGEVITGGCLSMSLIKSLVIFSSSSTSLIVRGAPPGPEPEPDT